jgi:hypothetical protein
MIDTVTRLLIAVGWWSVPVTLWRCRHQVRSTLWPAALLLGAVAVIWGGWFGVLAIFGDPSELAVGFDRALHIPTFLVAQFIVLYVLRRPDAVTRHPEPTDVP